MSAEAPPAALTEDLAAVETGPRAPKGRFMAALVSALCLGWAGFQLYIAYQPINATVARAWHLAFAIALVYLLFPLTKRARTAGDGGGIIAALSARDRIPYLDLVLAATAASCALYIWWDYEGIIQRQGLPSGLDVWMGVAMVVLLLEAARRALGPALGILAGVFLVYSFVGPYLPEILRHRGIPLEYVVNDMYLSTTGIFGVPLAVSTDFVFLFVLFGALLERAGAGRYFIDIAFAGLGAYRGGPAKAAIVASGMTGLVSGSSIANTVTTGTFTIPLMRRVGLPAYKAAAVEVAASTNGQLMPPVMGAAAFIMAEILGLPYLDVVRAALLPALISYLALFYVVHLEALKLGIRSLGRDELPRMGTTFIRGLHFLIPLAALIYYLVILRRTPITSALIAIESLVVIMLVQRPIAVILTRRAGATDPLGRALADAFVAGFHDVWKGLIGGSRNMMAVGVATAAAGIIVGVVTSTGLVGRFVTLIDVMSFGNLYLMLVLTAVFCLVLGMGLPTTATYIVMATLLAPAIAQLGADSGVILPLIGIHLFVFYFGILADDTPPVGLAAYAAAAIAGSEPIRTGVQGFAYDMRTAILPFLFLLNPELLTIAGVDAEGHILWIDNWLKVGFVFIVSLFAMFAFVAAIQGYLARPCGWFLRLVLLALALVIFQPAPVAEAMTVARELVQMAALLAFAAIYGIQKLGGAARQT